MAQHCARKQFRLVGIRIARFHEHRKAAHVVIAEEGRQAQRGFLALRVEHIAFEHLH